MMRWYYKRRYSRYNLLVNGVTSLYFIRANFCLRPYQLHKRWRERKSKAQFSRDWSRFYAHQFSGCRLWVMIYHRSRRTKWRLMLEVGHQKCLNFILYLPPPGKCHRSASMPARDRSNLLPGDGSFIAMISKTAAGSEFPAYRYNDGIQSIQHDVLHRPRVRRAGESLASIDAKFGFRSTAMSHSAHWWWAAYLGFKNELSITILKCSAARIRQRYWYMTFRRGWWE